MAALLAAACAGWHPDAARLDDAIARATDFLRPERGTLPPAFLVMDALHRWYGVEEFAGLPERYDAALEDAVRRRREISPESDLHPPFLRVFRRVIAVQELDRGDARTWEEFAPGMVAQGGINVINVPALYCDQLEPPGGYGEILEQGAAQGAYELTHVGQALMWLRENGCPSPLPDEFEARVAEAIGRIPDSDDRVTDLEIEATAFVLYMGRPDLVNPDFVDAMLRAQRADGGWTFDSAEPAYATEWHPTVLALWALLELRSPRPRGEAWLPQAGPDARESAGRPPPG